MKLEEALKLNYAVRRTWWVSGDYAMRYGDVWVDQGGVDVSVTVDLDAEDWEPFNGVLSEPDEAVRIVRVFRDGILQFRSKFGTTDMNVDDYPEPQATEIKSIVNSLEDVIG